MAILFMNLKYDKDDKEENYRPTLFNKSRSKSKN